MHDIISLTLQAAGVILAADFAAGLVHWFEDAYIREDTLCWAAGSDAQTSSIITCPAA